MTLQLFRSTLDIDTNDKSTITHILSKITGCQQLVIIGKKLSDKKGVHIILFCNLDCDICRFVFDDQTRFSYDLQRPKYARDILFVKKECINSNTKKNLRKDRVFYDNLLTGS